MVSVKGIYENGHIVLQDKITGDLEREIPVIVTFLEEVELKEETSNKIDLEQFSFKRSKRLLKDFDGSLSETLIEERRRFV